MNDREFDIVLYGATGYTARYIIKELEKSSLKIALAARNTHKIPETYFSMIECTVDKIHSLTKRTKIILNCAGPYATIGMSIMKACIATKTHYIDICGEPGFMEQVYLAYSDEAKRAGIRIIQGCGFDSAIADLGTMYISKLFDILKIDSTLSVSNFQINIGTWKSLINSVKLKRSPTVKKKNNLKEFRFNQKTKKYEVLFRGSDPYVVKRSAQYFKKKSLCRISYSAYIRIGNFFNLILYFIFGFLIKIFSKFNFLYSLLIKYPGLFSFGMVKKYGPSEEFLKTSTFEMVLKAEGIRNKKDLIKTLHIKGPDPGYKTTAVCVTQCTFTMLEESQSVPYGVLTPAIAFYRTKIIDRITENGISFKLR